MSQRPAIVAALLAASVAVAQGRLSEAGGVAGSPRPQTLLSLTGAQSAATRSNPIPNGQPFCVAADLIAQSGDWSGNGGSGGVPKYIAQIGLTQGAANSFSFLRVYNTVVAALYDGAGAEHIVIGTPVYAKRMSKYFHRVSACWTPSGGLTAYIDGEQAALTGGVSGVWTFAQPASMYVGQYNGVGGGAYGSGLANLCIAGPSTNSPTGVDTNDIANACGQFTTASNTAPCYGCITPDTSPVVEVLVIGDSISNIAWGETRPWPSRFNALKGPTYTVTNASYWGGQIFNMKSVYDASYHTNGMFDRCVFLGGVNDIQSGRTGLQAYTDAAALLDEMRADGCAPIIIRPTPARGGIGATTTEYDDYDTRLQAYCVANSLTCVDTRTTMGSGSGNKDLKASYDSSDHLHPNQSGLDELARLVDAAY